MAAEISGAPVPGEHRTVGRVMAILELVVAQDGRGVKLGDLAAHVDAPKSSVHGLAKGLVAVGYLREDDSRYHVGPAISSLIAVSNAPLPAVYRHTLERLSSQWSETAILSTLVGDTFVHLEIVEPTNVLIRAAPLLHVRLPLLPRSAGKCFLAFMEPKRQEAHIRRSGLDAEAATAMREELAEIRQTRIAVNAGGNTGIEKAFSSPIIRLGAPVTMAISIAGVGSRMQPNLDAIADSVRRAAESLSSREG
jgi:DNA-binding IclR family transcriptional regulator